MAGDCIFCKIVNGDIPCSKIYEEQRILAFMDINPLSPGHCLVIPKEHHATLIDCPSDLLAELASRLPAIAQAVIAVTNADGYNLLNNNHRSAGQLVDHVHFHIIPRKQGDGIIAHAKPSPYAPGQLEKLTNAILAKLKSI